jgi:dihydrofolate synthase/folylpolyglutamate synthase
LISVITNVSKDHQEHLGNKLGLIAFEKAGIIKSGVPVVCGVSTGVAARVIKERANEEKAPLFDVLGQSGRLSVEKKRSRFIFRYVFGGETFAFSPSLRGEHQGNNAALAIASASVLSRVWKPLDKRKIIRGVEQAKWEGRLEQISRNPKILLDGAHNEAGAVVLSRYIEDFCPGPRVLVFAMMRDKAIRRVAGILFPRVEKVVLSSIPYPRAASPEEILLLTQPFKRKIIVEPSLRKAVNIARAECGRSGSVLITGSLFLVGEAKKHPCIIRAKNAKFTP